MGLGDYSNYQKWYTSKTIDKVMLATDATAQLAGILTPKDANHQLFIQRITFNIVTSAAQAVTFQDTASTPIKIAAVPASQTTPLVFEYGPKGVALTAGKNLDIIATAGVAAMIHIEAYERIVNAAIFVGGQNQADTGTQPGQ